MLFFLDFLEMLGNSTFLKLGNSSQKGLFWHKQFAAKFLTVK